MSSLLVIAAIVGIVVVLAVLFAVGVYNSLVTLS